MKRIISIILSITLLTSLVPLSTFAITAPEDAVTLTQKQQLAQIYYEKYGDDGILEEGVSYTWDCSGETSAEIDPSGSVASPLWGAGTTSEDYKVHGKIIDAASTINGGALVPDRYMKIVRSICQKCDASWGTQSDYYSGRVHATDNYIATFKYLWTFALDISKCENITPQIIDEVSVNAWISVPEKIRDTYSMYLLDELTLYALKTYYNTEITYDEEEFNYKISEHTKSRRCKYIIYGLMSHFIGDLYAHRIIIPEKAIATLLLKSNPNYVKFDGSDSHKAFYFNPDHFVDFDKSSLKTDIKNGTLAFNKLKEYYTGSGDTPIKMLNTNYVDNAKFYSDRVDEAALTLSAFFLAYSEGYDSSILEPIDYELKNFDSYLEAMGEG